MRKTGSSRAETWPIVRQAAIDLLFKHGYEAMNLRELSQMAGLQAGSLYNYFSSKQELLYRLICETMDEMLIDIEKTLESVTDPVERAKRFIEVMVYWHSERRNETFIGHMELRSLPEGHFDTYVALRTRFETIFLGIIKLGCKKGVFAVPDDRIATFAIIQSLTGICHWYRPKARLSVKQITKIYTLMILAQLQSEKKKVSRAA